MTAGLRQYLMLAGVGVAGGFALIVALLGPGEMMKRAHAVLAPNEAPRTLAGGPGAGTSAPQEKPAADKAAREAALPPAPAARTEAEPPPDEAPSLDIVRVEPNGDAVIAGRTMPNAAVEILRDNNPIARAKADGNGQFAIVPPTLPTGNSEISYRSVSPDGKETRGRESVAIVVAENRATKPLVAVSMPDKPTVVLSQPETPAAASPDLKTAEAKKALSGKAEEKSRGRPQDKPQRLSALPEPKAASGGDGSVPVKVVSIDAQEGGRLDVTGVSKPGASLRLYLNDTLVASGKSGPDGKLSFTIGRGVRPGGYQVRIDQVQPETGKVEHRAQVAFAFPESAAPKLAARESPPPAAVPPPLPAKPYANRKPAGTLAERAPSQRDGNATSGASPPPAPAAEARAANRQAEAAKPGSPAPKPEVQPQRQASRAESEPAKKEPRATPQPEKPIASEKPAEKAATPEKEPPAVAAVTPKPEAPAPGAETRMAETSVPKPSAAGPQSGSASPSPKPSEPVEGMKAETPSPGATASVTPEPTPSDKPGTVFVPEISTARITRGDNLWQISRRTYGNGLRYTVIFDANKEQIRDPDLIYPGQIFVLPKDEAPKRG